MKVAFPDKGAAKMLHRIEKEYLMVNPSSKLSNSYPARKP